MARSKIHLQYKYIDIQIVQWYLYRWLKYRELHSDCISSETYDNQPPPPPPTPLTHSHTLGQLPNNKACICLNTADL